MLDSRQCNIYELTVSTCLFNTLWMWGGRECFPSEKSQVFHTFQLGKLGMLWMLNKKTLPGEKVFKTQLQTTHPSSSYDANIVNHTGKVYSLRNSLMRIKPFFDKILRRVCYCRRQTHEKIYSRRQTPHKISS